MLFRDRCAHARIARLMKAEARMSREAWGLSMDTSDVQRYSSLQTQMAELQRQQVPTKGPAQPELPKEAGSSS
ncbi:hypothetical protein Tco_0362260, partial [Tanacetum coccineum]